MPKSGGGGTVGAGRGKGRSRAATTKKDADEVEFGYGEIKKEFNPGSARFNEWHKQFDKKFEKMSVGTDAMINSYTGGWHSTINRQLAAGANLKDISANQLFGGSVKEFQKALGHKLNAPVKVYRSAKFKPDVLEGMRQAATAGESVRLKGFQSTSLSSDVAHEFYGPGRVKLEITAKRGLYVESISSSKGEFELIQRHNTKYKVTGRSVVNGVETFRLKEI